MTIKELLRLHQINKHEGVVEVNPGWINYLDNAFRLMIHEGWDRDLLQVKQKFGVLRIYIGAGTPELYALLTELEDNCLLCEFCGIPHGHLLPITGLALCDSCKEKRDKEREEKRKLRGINKVLGNK